jgi:deoxyribonuclease V
MKIEKLHSWNPEYDEARRLQEELSGRLKLTGAPAKVELVAGCDVSGESHGNKFFAAVVIMKYPGFEILETVSAEGEIDFPYIPGLLSFREMPVLLKAWEKIENVPALVFCDGSGLIHPRKMGLACHLGLWLNLQVIGVAKNLLCGEYNGLGTEKNDVALIQYHQEILGAAVRTRKGVKPLFISQGNHIDLHSAIEWTLKTCGKYRQPEPIRAAHNAANEARKMAAGK